MAKPAPNAAVPDNKNTLSNDAIDAAMAKLNTRHVTEVNFARGQTLHRIHHQKYLATHFNSSAAGNARFSPIKNITGETIPTLYAGSSKDCAFMETIFHDVPFSPGFKTLDKHKLNGQLYSTITIAQDLTLIDLSSISLRKLGITRTQLIDTEKDQYPVTRLWAETLHHQCPRAQGLLWVSRQDDSARALVLFADRIPANTVQQLGTSQSLTEDPVIYADMLDLAARLDVLVVQGLS